MSKQFTRAELLASPMREGWQKPTTYRELYVVPDGTKHDSGYALMRIVGLKEDRSLETAAYCDDICWVFGTTGNYAMRTDMLFPSKVVRHWGAQFVVGASLSSTDVIVQKEPK